MVYNRSPRQKKREIKYTPDKDRNVGNERSASNV